MQRPIPQYPGAGINGKKPPAPPKYLVKTGADNRTELLKVDVQKRLVEPPKISVPTGDLPTAAKMVNISPKKTWDQPPHRYGAVDSKSEMKRSGNESDVPSYVGNSYMHVPNAHHRPHIPPSKAPAIPRPLVGGDHPDFINCALLSNRSADGKILGSHQKRYVDAKNVPTLQSDVPVGPDNPVKTLNEEWSACWDDEAGAVYYYNQISGEATWIAPEI